MLECSGIGFCGDEGSCVCPTGRAGSACETEACVNDCSGHGICLHKRCRCAPGFEGNDCSTLSRTKGLNELENSKCGGECGHNAVCNEETGRCECTSEDGTVDCNTDSEGTPASKMSGGLSSDHETAKQDRMVKLRSCASQCGDTCSMKCTGESHVGECETDCNIDCVTKCTSTSSF